MADNLQKGDLIKQKALGGHVMTVVAVSKDRKRVTGSYKTPDGNTHREIMLASDVKRVELA